MSELRTAQQILDREYLELRAKILELAASFDRMQRGEGEFHQDRRAKLIADALQILSNDSNDKATQIQLLFSREYSPTWRQELDV